PRLRCSRASPALPGPAHEGDVLFAVEFVCDRRSHAALSGGDFQKLFPVLPSVGDQAAVWNHLKDKIRCCSDRTAARSTSTPTSPAFCARDRIKCHKESATQCLRRPDVRRN